MNLETFLENARQYRKFAMPETAEEICLVLESRNMGKLPGWLKRHPDCRISHIVVADLDESASISSNLVINGLKPKIWPGMAALAELGRMPKVFLFAAEWITRVASMAIPGLSDETIYIVESPDEQFRPRRPMPDYYEKNRTELEDVWSLLAGDDDKIAYGSRIKALMTGNSGYLKIACHMEYDHPLVGIADGDFVLDGGLSDMVSAQEILLEKAGKNSVIHGFEPIPWMAKAAAANLAKYPNYHVHCLGLADRAGQASFLSLRDSSHLAPENAENSIRCELTSIDKFTRDYGIDRVDAIKLDVEGAELSALKGGARLIAACYPRLIVCLYHKPQDLYEIPLYVNRIAPGYEMRIAHSSAGFTDTILYAKKRG